MVLASKMPKYLYVSFSPSVLIGLYLVVPLHHSDAVIIIIIFIIIIIHYSFSHQR